MGWQRKSTGVKSGTGVASRPRSEAITALPTPPNLPKSRQVVGRVSRLPSGRLALGHSTVGERPSPLPPPDEPLLQQHYRELIRKHLSKLLDSLFAEFTGVRFHIAWRRALPKQRDAKTPLSGCSVCCRLTGSPLLPACRTCGPRQLARALSADGAGHRFTCRLGVRNYWIPIRVRAETLGFACLQALEGSPARPLTTKRSARAAIVLLRRAGARVLSRVKFARAARFLRHIVQHVQTASLADLRKADLTSAGHVVIALEKEQARLRATLQRHLPPASQAPRRSGSESHSEQIMHWLLQRLALDYAKPITLQQYSCELGMNAAYLSDLFSRAVGIPFKTYLTDLRLAKARDLLGDPTKTVAEVAYAVGYASENRFRMVFKNMMGLPPRIWRGTLRMSQPTLLVWLLDKSEIMESLNALFLV
jgi:AraC-like DNA-binding protein